MAGLGDQLREVVGADHVLEDADLRARYEHDWKGGRGGEALLAVRPASTNEVALDAWGITLLGVTREVAGFITEAEHSGLGTSDYKSLKLVEVSG